MKHSLRNALLAGAVLAALAVTLALRGGADGSGTHVENSRGNSKQGATATAAGTRPSAVAPGVAGPSYAASLPGSSPTPATRTSALPLPAAPLPAVQADASASLAAALRDGDLRSPPLLRDTPPEPASAAELADAAAYRRYEGRQQARLYRAFEQEAVIALADLQRDLERGRDAQLPQAQLAEGEEKARKLAETLRRLQDGELQPQP